PSIARWQNYWVTQNQSVDQRIAGELGVAVRQVNAAVELLDGGATVPFIARYRKEATGALDDAQLRTLEERLRYLRELDERPDATAALDGARAILVERFAEDADLLGELRESMAARGSVTSRVRDGQQTQGAKFADYFEFSEPFARLPSHRVLALFRGEKEEVLDLTLEPGAEDAEFEQRIAGRFGIRDERRPADPWLQATVHWAWRTRILTHRSEE